MGILIDHSATFGQIKSSNELAQTRKSLASLASQTKTGLKYSSPFLPHESEYVLYQACDGTHCIQVEPNVADLLQPDSIGLAFAWSSL